MIELLVLIGLVIFGVFIVGAVMLHILVGLVLLPFQLAVGLFKGLALGFLAIPFAAIGFSVLMVVLSVLFALGIVALVFGLVF